MQVLMRESSLNVQSSLVAGTASRVRECKLRDDNLIVREKRVRLLDVTLEVRIASSVPVLQAISNLFKSSSNEFEGVVAD